MSDCNKCACYYLNCEEDENNPDSECTHGMVTFTVNCDFFDEVKEEEN